MSLKRVSYIYLKAHWPKQFLMWFLLQFPLGFFVMPRAATPNYTCKPAVISVWFSGTCNFSVITGRFQWKQLILLTRHVSLHWYKIVDLFIMCHCKSSHIGHTWTLKLQLVAVQKKFFHFASQSRELQRVSLLNCVPIWIDLFKHFVQESMMT